MDTLLGLLFIIGGIGTWYFIKKKPDKKKRNISLGLLVLSIILIGVMPTSSNEDTAEKNHATSSVSKEKEATSESTLSSSELAASQEASEAEKKASEESKAAEEQRNKDITIMADEPTSEQAITLTQLAQQRFDEVYPYKGSKIHSVLGVIQDWTQKDGSWYYKSEATIVNAFGAERKATVEINISPVGPDSGNVSIIDY